MTMLEKLAGIAIITAAGLGVALLLTPLVNDALALAAGVAVLLVVARGWVALFEVPDRDEEPDR